MRALILAAGRGERLRPLTDRTPKPLIEVGGKALIVWQIERLRAAGITDLVVNLSHLGEAISTTLGDGASLGVQIRYSPEPPGALETAGGIANALPLLGAGRFMVVNADVWTDYPFGRLSTAPMHSLAHLVMVDNPAEHPVGDFALRSGKIVANGFERLTFAGIGVYSPKLFAAIGQRRAPLAPLLRTAMQRGEVTGEYYRGQWWDVGTPASIARLNAFLTKD